MVMRTSEDPGDGDEDIEDPGDGDEDTEDPGDGDEDTEDPGDDPVAEAQVAEAKPGEEIVIELKGVDRSPDSETVMQDVMALGVSVLREGLTYYLETLPEEGQITYPAEVSEADLPYQLSDRFVEYTAPEPFTENDSFEFSVSDEAGEVENRSIAKTVTIQPAE